LFPGSNLDSPFFGPGNIHGSPPPGRGGRRNGATPPRPPALDTVTERPKSARRATSPGDESAESDGSDTPVEQPQRKAQKAQINTLAKILTSFKTKRECTAASIAISQREQHHRQNPPDNKLNFYTNDGYLDSLTSGRTPRPLSFDAQTIPPLENRNIASGSNLTAGHGGLGIHRVPEVECVPAAVYPTPPRTDRDSQYIRYIQRTLAPVFGGPARNADQEPSLDHIGSGGKRLVPDYERRKSRPSCRRLLRNKLIWL
jgi:hypothetical protein